MCVAICSRRLVFFWTHDDCARDICPLAGVMHSPCRTCRHRRDDDTCGLTRAPLSETGCCHWNVTPVEGRLRVTPAMVAPLAGFFDLIRHILAGLPHQVVDDHWLLALTHTLVELGVPYQSTTHGVLVDPVQRVLVIDEPVAAILDRLDAPYRVDPTTGDVWVDVAELNLPQIFGRADLE
jgi:hypothetical protein